MDARRIHRLHDGELDAAERAAAEEALQPADREGLLALGELREALRNTLDVEVGLVDVWAAVERGIAAAAPAEPAGRVLPLSPRLKRAHRRSSFVPALLAAAAAIVLLLAPWRERPAEAATDNCAIESLEVTGALATVIEIPAVNGRDTTTVVWLDEENAR